MVRETTALQVAHRSRLGCCVGGRRLCWGLVWGLVCCVIRSRCRRGVDGDGGRGTMALWPQVGRMCESMIDAATQEEIERLYEAVDEFAVEMKARLREQAMKGYRGWDDPQQY